MKKKYKVEYVRSRLSGPKARGIVANDILYEFHPLYFDISHVVFVCFMWSLICVFDDHSISCLIVTYLFAVFLIP